MAGEKLETFAGFETSIALFNTKIVSFCLLGRWDSASMVES
jgi:hypothetical protein